jgi:hypothetical protein
MKTNPVKTKFKSTIRAVCHSFGGVICAGIIMLIASGAQAQNLFVSNYANGGPLYQYAPDGHSLYI